MAGIIIADDSPFVKMKLVSLIEKCGHEIVGEASSAAELLLYIMEKEPELVIVDISMPGLSGTEIIRSIQNLGQNTKIIVCSALGQHEVIVSAVQAGAHDFIVKPFFDSRVVAALNGLLKHNGPISFVDE